MIFLDISTEEWMHQHEELRVETRKCVSCRKSKIATTRPFIEKGWVGLIAPPCHSCGWDSGFSVQSARSQELDNFCNALVKEWKIHQALKGKQPVYLTLIK